MTIEETYMYDEYVRIVSYLIQRNFISLETLKIKCKDENNSLTDYYDSILNDKLENEGKEVPWLTKQLSISKIKKEAIKHCINNYEKIKGVPKKIIVNDKNYKYNVEKISELIKKNLITEYTLFNKTEYMRKDIIKSTDNFKNKVLIQNIFSLDIKLEKEKLEEHETITKALQYCIDNFDEIKKGGQE